MNPVLRKDLLALFRMPSVAAIQITFVAVLAFWVISSWPEGGILAVAVQGRDELLLGLVIGQLVLLILFVPSMAATAIASERDANTLEMLYASRLSPAQIVMGKVLVAIAFPLLLMLAGLPFMALLVWRGDVDGRQLILSYTILAMAALLIAILSLAISAYSRQTGGALVVAYVTVLTLCGGLLVPASLILRESFGPLAEVLHYAHALAGGCRVERIEAKRGRCSVWRPHQ